MPNLQNLFDNSHYHTTLLPNSDTFISGGLFLQSSISPSLFHSVSSETCKWTNSDLVLGILRRGNEFMPTNLKSSRAEKRQACFEANWDKRLKNEAKIEDNNNVSLRNRGGGGGAMNTMNHLLSGAVASMVTRTLLAPLERLKLEYIIRGEQKKIDELIRTIAASQGLRGFWKGNFVNILRTAPFKAINFCAYDTYSKQIYRLSGNEETTNFERFIAGAVAGITATVLCLPLDTVRTKMVAPGGEALGGLISAFHYVIQTEGFFSLYKGLLPSIMSVAPSAAVFYGVYDILKSAYLHSPQGRKRIQQMNHKVEELSTLSQLELGPVRTLLYGAISGACAEAATYPFEVVRRRLQMQVHKLSLLETCIQIVEQRGVSALYVGLVPSLLQVLPSAAISYFMYEVMKIVLKVK